MTNFAQSKKWLLGSGMILVAVFGISLLSLKGNSVYFYTPAEAVSQARTLSQKELRIGGMVKSSSVDWEAKNLNLAFVLTDLKGTEIAVKHRGTPPDMFKENSGVIVEGKISESGDRFIAYRLFVKHSEEYKIPDSTASRNHELLQRSIIKNES